MYYSTSSGKIELKITKAQAEWGAHPGPCDGDIAELRKVPAIARQLAKIDRAILSAELKEYGAWDETERLDHEQNLSRLLWIACGDICEEAES